jgi:hypothetical protein
MGPLDALCQGASRRQVESMVAHDNIGDRRSDARSRGELTRAEMATDGRRLAFLGCVERLVRLIEQESAALRSKEAFDFEEYNSRKAHALLEFSRASRSVGASSAAPAVEAGLARLRARLVENAELLNHRLEAMREIAEIMICTIEMAESDGTYSTRVQINR